MSEENVEIVRRWMEAWNRGDRERVAEFFDHLDPEVEWDASRIEELNPDIGGVLHGTIWHVWTLRDGKMVRGRAFTAREQALKAAGLSE